MKKFDLAGYDLKEFNDFVTAIKNFVQGGGMAIGRIIVLLLDVFLGGIVLSKLFSDYSVSVLGWNVSGTTLAWLFSFGLWYIQIKLWDKVLEDGIDWNEDWFNLLLIGIVAVGDTLIDSSAVFIWQSKALEAQLSGVFVFGNTLNIYNLLINALVVLTIIITGFGEYLDRTSNERLKKTVRKFVPADRGNNTNTSTRSNLPPVSTVFPRPSVDTVSGKPNDNQEAVARRMKELSERQRQRSNVPARPTPMPTSGNNPFNNKK